MLEPFRKLNKLDKFVWRVLTADLKQRSPSESNAIREHQSHFPVELKKATDSYFKDVTSKTKHTNAFFDKNNLKNELSASPYFYVSKKDQNGTVLNREDILVSYYRDQIETSNRVAQRRAAPSHGVTEDGHVSFYEKNDVPEPFANEFMKTVSAFGIPALAYYGFTQYYNFVGLYLGLPMLAVGVGAASGAFLKAYDALTGKNKVDNHFARRVYRVAFAGDSKTVELKFANGEKVLVPYDSIKEYGYKTDLNTFITEKLGHMPAFAKLPTPGQNLDDEDLLNFFKRESEKKINALVANYKLTGEGAENVREASKIHTKFVASLKKETEKLPLKRFVISNGGQETKITFEANGLESLKKGKTFLDSLTQAETSQKLPAGTFYKQLVDGTLDMNVVEGRIIEEYLYDSDQELKPELYSKYRQAGDELLLKQAGESVNTEDAYALLNHKTGNAADTTSEGEKLANLNEMKAARRINMLKDAELNFDAKVLHLAFEETLADHRNAVNEIADKCDARLLQLTDLSLDKAKAARNFSSSRNVNDLSVSQYLANTGFDATSIAEAEQEKAAYAHESAHGSLSSVLRQSYKDGNYRSAGVDRVEAFKKLAKA